jgi:predicted  nucleic acid-binding Zn-ribbon protein
MSLFSEPQPDEPTPEALHSARALREDIERQLKDLERERERLRTELYKLETGAIRDGLRDRLDSIDSKIRGILQAADEAGIAL